MGLASELDLDQQERKGIGDRLAEEGREDGE
jgi:hypothetical protein